MMKKILIAGAALAALLGAPALAADMALKAPPMAPPPVFSWTGFYAGINGGWGTGETSGDILPTYFSGNYRINGGLVGGTLGYNYQFSSNWVLGVEGDWDWADINGSTTFAKGNVTTDKVEDLGTLRGRLGYAWGRSLVYATGGWAWTSRMTAFDGIQPPAVATDSHALNGYSVGAGFEYSVIPNVSLKAEYLYVDLNTEHYFGPAGCVTSCSLGAKVNVFRAGANWHFTGM